MSQPINNDRKRVLIAEDDNISYLYQSSILKEIGFQVVRAQNGLEAVEICQGNPDINLILMDINMPVMDGIEATKQIKKLKNDLIVIMVTAYTGMDIRNRAEAAGCNDYVSKPIVKQNFIRLIRKYISADQPD